MHKNADKVILSYATSQDCNDYICILQEMSSDFPFYGINLFVYSPYKQNIGEDPRLKWLLDIININVINRDADHSISLETVSVFCMSYYIGLT